MKDTTIKGIATAALVSATLGVSALSSNDEPLPTPIQYETETTDIVIPDHDRDYVEREEWDTWEQEFRYYLTVTLPQETSIRIAKILEVKAKDGYLDNIKVWKTATQSQSSGEIRKREGQ